jgi:hypothetical protein
MLLLGYSNNFYKGINRVCVTDKPSALSRYKGRVNAVTTSTSLTGIIDNDVSSDPAESRHQIKRSETEPRLLR